MPTKKGLSKYLTPDELWDWFEKYKVHCKSNPIKVHTFVGKDGRSDFTTKERPLSIEGWMNYMEDNVCRVDPYFYNSNGNYDDYLPICSRIKREIRQDQVDGGMAGIFNPSITQRLNNLVERTDVTSKDEKLPAGGQVIDLSKLSDDALKEIKDQIKEK